MDHARRLKIEGLGGANATAIQFDGTYGARSFTNLVAFCVDVYHDIQLGDFETPLKYTDDVAFTTDSNFAGALVLSEDQKTQVGRLINYGTNAFYNAPTNSTAARNYRWDELAAVQGAIWQVVSGRNVTSTNASLDAWINDLAGVDYTSHFNAAYGTTKSNFAFLTPGVYPDKSGSQSYGTAVPEPAAWLLMILGFGGVGATLRARRGLALAQG